MSALTRKKWRLLGIELLPLPPDCGGGLGRQLSPTPGPAFTPDLPVVKDPLFLCHLSALQDQTPCLLWKNQQEVKGWG